jgi:hypothetical protein
MGHSQLLSHHLLLSMGCYGRFRYFVRLFLTVGYMLRSYISLVEWTPRPPCLINSLGKVLSEVAQPMT